MQVVLQKHPSRESGRVKIFAACALPLPTASIVKSPRSKKGYGQRAFKSSAIAVGPGKYGWEQPKQRCMPGQRITHSEPQQAPLVIWSTFDNILANAGQDNVDMVAIADIKRPLQGTRSNGAHNTAHRLCANDLFPASLDSVIQKMSFGRCKPEAEGAACRC